MLKYYLLIAFSSLLLIGLSFYFLSEKYAIGDNFPETSVYRSDAKGQSVIFETLMSLDSKHVTTYEDPLKSISKYNESLLIFNANVLLKRKKVEAIAQHIHEGNHLLIVKSDFKKFSQQEQIEDNTQEDTKNSEEDEQENGEKDQKDSKLNKKDENLKRVFSEKSVGLNSSLTDKLYELVESSIVDSKSNITSNKGAVQLKSKSKDVFSKIEDSFQIEFNDLDDYPILISVDFGKGKLFLLSDHYYLSNEYFLQSKDDEFIDKFFVNNPKSNIVFDQTMIGVMVSPGIMGLVRKYHFEGVLISFVLIGLILIWRLGMEHYFTNNYGSQEKINDDKVFTEDALKVMIAKNISPSDLVSHAFKEFENNAVQKTLISQVRLEEAKKMASKSSYKSVSEIIEVYNKIVQCVKLGKSK